LSTLALLEALRRPDRARLVAYAVVTTLLLYANLFSILFIVAEAGVVVWRGSWRRLLPAWTVTAACSLPLALYQVIYEHTQNAWIPTRSVLDLAHAFLSYTGRRFGLVLLVVLGVFALRSRMTRDRADISWAVAVAAVVPFPVLWALSWVNHEFVDRYLIASLAAIVLIAGAGAAELSERRHSVVALVLVAAIGAACVSLSLQVERQRFKVDDPRSAAHLIAMDDRPGDAIYFADRAERLPVDRYLPSSRSPNRPADVAVPANEDIARLGLLTPRPMASSVVDEKLVRVSRVWVVDYAPTSAAYVPSAAPLTPAIKARLRPGDAHRFGHLVVVLWS
jgi:hypothetical protein